MIDFLTINITNSILIILLITVLIFFCLYIYLDNKILKKQIEELRKENKNLLEKKIISQENVDTMSIKNISNEKINDYNNEKINITSSLNKEKIEPQQKEIANKYAYTQNNEEKTNKEFNLSELINKNNVISIKEKESSKEKEYDYLQEISNRLTEELKPQTIELTEYEKKQEEQAVISYKELLKFKDNNYIDEQKQETINFIEELKNLRNSLK